VQEKSWSIYWR